MKKTKKLKRMNETQKARFQSLLEATRDILITADAIAGDSDEYLIDRRMALVLKNLNSLLDDKRFVFYVEE